MDSLIRRAARGRRYGVRHASVAAACALAGVAAHAAGFSVGAGAGIDRGRTDCVAAYACDHDSAYGKLFAGYQLPNDFELQALYFDAGHFAGGDTSPLGTAFGGRFKVSGFGVAAGYRWAFAPGWSLKGQVGVARVRTRYDYASPFSGDVGMTTTQPLVGVSVGYQIAPRWRLSLDLDDTRFKVHATHGSLRALGAAAEFAF